MQKQINYYKEKEKMIKIFQDTLKATQKRYLRQTADSIRESILYQEGDKRYKHPGDDRPYDTMEVHVYKDTTVDTAIRIKKKHFDDKVAILNFASAKSPGGKVVDGSIAQEECICRCSNLYSILTDPKFKKGYYEFHKYSHSKLYTDKLIYSPDVILFRNDAHRYHFNKWNKHKKNGPEYPVDVITCAAPNIRGLGGGVDKQLVMRNDMNKIYVERIRAIFLSAYTHGVDHLILGAWGCGVFRNDPKEIAKAFHEVQDEFKGCFKNIVYSIYCDEGERSENYEAFREEFKLSWMDNKNEELLDESEESDE